MELNTFSQHEQALKFRALRNQVLSSNIANADTPNYKARDINFRTALSDASSGLLSLKTSHDLHQKVWGAGGDAPKALYRVPTQPTLDGNTVQADVEQAEFAENTLRYRATLAFLDGQIRSLRYAIKGGE